MKFLTNKRVGIGLLVFIATLWVYGLVRMRDRDYGDGWISPFHSKSATPILTYSLERTGPLEVAKVFGRSHGCQNADPDLIEMIVRTSLDLNIEPTLAASIMDQESGCDPLAVSNRGAVGLMQVMPKVWKTRFDFSEINLFNPKQNIEVGLKILSPLVLQYGEKEALERYQGLGVPSNPNYSAQVLGRKDNSK